MGVSMDLERIGASVFRPVFLFRRFFRSCFGFASFVKFLGSNVTRTLSTVVWQTLVTLQWVKFFSAVADPLFVGTRYLGWRGRRASPGDPGSG